MMNWDSRLLPVAVKNNSGERIPPFACMEIDYTGTSGVAMSAAGDVVWLVKKPTSAAASASVRVLINGAKWIEIDGYGTAGFNSKTLALINPTSLSLGASIGAVAGSWAMAAGSGWVYKSQDAVPPAYENGSLKSAYVEPEKGAGGGSELLEVQFSSNSHDWSAGDPARGFAADRTSPVTVTGGSPTDIENPFDLNWLSGDDGLLLLRGDGTYVVVKVFAATCRRFRFKLSSNAPNGLTPDLTTTALSPTNSEGGPPPSGTVTVKDIYGVAHNAKTDHKGVAEFDYNNGWWFATICEHNAWRFRGTLNGSLSGGASFFSVNPVVAFNGKLPSGPLNVYNMHSWDAGTSGHIVSCEWNPVDGRYEAYQMRCPV